MEIKCTIIYLGMYRGVFKLVYIDGYHWEWDSLYEVFPDIELKVNEPRKILNEWETNELFQFKPEDLSEAE